MRLAAPALPRAPRPAPPASWWLWWLAAAVCACVPSYAALSRPANDSLADLHVYVGSVIGLRHGASLYDFITPGGAPFTYPPFAGLLMVPLGYVPMWPLGVAWTAGTVLAIGVLAAVVARAARESGTVPGGRWLAPALAVALYVSAPVSSNLRFGQVSVILALLVVLDLLAMGRSRYSGMLIGAAAAIKLTPLIFIPLLWFGGRRTAAVRAAGTFAGAAALAWLVLPGDSRRFWTIEMWQVNRVGHIATQGNQSINGALLRLGVADHPRTLLMLTGAAIVGVVALWRAAQAARFGDWPSATVVTGSASVAMSPVSWTHHQAWLVLVVLLPVSRAVRPRLAWAALVLSIMVLPVTWLGTLAPGPVGAVLDESRLLLAITTACVVPVRRRTSAPGRPRRAVQIARTPSPTPGGESPRSGSPGWLDPRPGCDLRR